MTDDPYLDPDTGCLHNKLGLADLTLLRESEARIVSIRDVELARTVVPGSYNATHLQDFHRHLFHDVYPWAGEFRRVDISKAGVPFASHPFIGEQLSVLLSRLERENWLAGFARSTFVQKLAYYYGELNAVHPFREGNGRTQRAFLRQLSAAAGWRLDWSELNRDDNIQASRENAVTASADGLIRVLEPVVVRI